jgi:hypothetical protein
MTLATVSDTQTDLAHLRRELERVKQQRDALAEVCQAQHTLLTEIQQETIVLNRHALCAVGPQIRAAPASCAKALLRLVEDLGPDGITRQGWTGLALGEELGLARATRDRLVGPLEAAGAVEAVAVTSRKTVHYRVTLALNPTLSARIDGLQIRAQRALFLTNMPDGSSISTPSARSDPTALRSQRVPRVPNTLSARIDCPNTPSARDGTPCLYVVDSDSGIPPGDQQQQRDPTPAEHSAFRELLIGEPVWRPWMVHPPELVLACVLHAGQEPGVTNPVGLLRAMLEQAKGAPGKQYVDRAVRLLAGEPEPDPYQAALAVQAAANLPPPLPPELEPDASLDAMAGSSRLTWREVWLAVRNQLELQLNARTFEVLRDARPVRFVDGVLTVRVRRACDVTRLAAVDPVREHVRRLVEQPITVRYVTADPEPVHA